MSHAAHFLGILALIFVAAKALGALAKRFGQPAVLGELAAGVLLGVTFAGPVNPQDEVLALMAEIGVVILLLEIGLETDLGQLIRAGGNSTVVALGGVILPFVGGYAACLALGMSNIVAVVVGAALTATSVGITARVLADIGKLQTPESQIILGAAVIDDVLGLIILAVVGKIAAGHDVSALGVVGITAAAFGFLVGTIVVGSFVVPWMTNRVRRLNIPGDVETFALVLAFGLAWLADLCGSALILGAFAAGLLLKRSEHSHDIEIGVSRIAYFFVPIFFVCVGAAVDLRVFNPFVAENHSTLLVGSLLIVVAVLGKFLAGYGPFWFKGRKAAIGVGMVPRGEVGLIFAQMGLAAEVFDEKLFSAVAVMVMVTTFLAPPLLRVLFAGQDDGK